MRLFAAAVRLLALPAAVAACLVALAAPASAHTIGGVGPMSFKTTISSVDPQIPGISVRERGNGAMLDIANTTDTEVVVLGYDQEPYLRIGPAGVFENVRSSATYLNKKWDRSAVPPVVDATAAPLWRQVSTANHARWTDHRIHWMGEDLPPQVSADRTSFHHISDWTVDLTYGGAPMTVHGTLDWVPGPSPVAGLVTLGLVAAGVAALTLWRRRWSAALAVVAAACVVIDAAHAAGIATYLKDSRASQLTTFATGNLLRIAIWAALVWGAVLLARRRPVGLWVAGAGGVLIAVVSGLPELSSLWTSWAPGSWPTGVVRFMSIMTTGSGCGLAIAAFVGLRRYDPVPSARYSRRQDGVSGPPQRVIEQAVRSDASQPASRPHPVAVKEETL